MTSQKLFQAVVFSASVSFITYFALTNQIGAQNGTSEEVPVEPAPQPTEEVPVDPEQVSTPEPEVVPPEY
jgi:hypothetical protein